MSNIHFNMSVQIDSNVFDCLVALEVSSSDEVFKFHARPWIHTLINVESGEILESNVRLRSISITRSVICE
ncbi:hypothetical protein QFZ78_000919 [Paenibacillus sp. V4I5]|nr:hypothetical protein [Paenibacillus sp. V4I5]